jgi:hypothetical protein
LELGTAPKPAGMIGLDDLFPGIDMEMIALPSPHDLLAGHIRSVWQTNWQSKQVIEQEDLANERRVKGEYDPERLKAIKDAGLTEDKPLIVYQKCRDCASWVLDTIDPVGDRTWDVEPDGVIEIPPELHDRLVYQKQMEMLQAIMQQAQQSGQQVDENQAIRMIQESEDDIIQLILDEAKATAEERCSNMEQLIISQLREGGWDESYKSCVDDFSKRKAAVMKGPLPKQIKSLKYDETDQRYKVVEKIIPYFWRVNSLDAYPAPNALNPNDGPFIELEHYDPVDLSRLIGQPGYDSDELRTILSRFPNGHHESTVIDQERKWLENEDLSGSQISTLGGKIDCINFWGPVQGKVLRAWGMSEKKVPEEEVYYDVNAKMVDNIVFQARLNPDPLGLNPYDSASFEKNNDSMWGRSVADLMTSIDNRLSATIRNMMSNIAISSGPVWEIDETRLAADDDGDIYPNKKIMSTNKRMQESPAIRMYQAQLNAQELLVVIGNLTKEADDAIVPAFANTAAGGERTTGALNIRMSAAGRNINMATDNFDTGILQAKIRRLFNWNMIHSDDQSIKGSTRVVARSTKSQSAREQLAVRQVDFIDRISRNAVMAGIAGQKGIAYGMGEAAKGLGWNVRQLLPNLEAIEKSPNPPLSQGQPGEQPPAENAQTLDASGNPAGGQQEQVAAQ